MSAVTRKHEAGLHARPHPYGHLGGARVAPQQSPVLRTGSDHATYASRYGKFPATALPHPVAPNAINLGGRGAAPRFGTISAPCAADDVHPSREPTLKP